MNQPSTQSHPVRRALVIILGLAALAASIWGFSVMMKHRAAAAAKQGPGAGQDDHVVPVVLATVEKRDLPIYLEGLGAVSAFNTVTVKPQVDGKLEEVLFKEGQTVKKGDLLARIDARPFAIAVQQAQAALARDVATLKNAKTTLERNKGLVTAGIAAQQQVDDSTAALGTADANVRADQAAIDNAQLNLTYCRIQSPLDGVTGVRQVDAGNLVHQADANGLVIITEIDPIAVFFTLPEDDLPEVSKELAGGAVTVQAYARDGSTKLGEGQVLMIDNQINQGTATIRLKAKFDNHDKQLWPNQFVKARMLLRTQTNAIVIPAEAVTRGPKGTMVYVVGDDNLAAVRPIEIDSMQGNKAIVKSGLKEGERVVSEGQNQLKPGSKVAAHVPTASTTGDPAVPDASAKKPAAAAPGDKQ